jgi:signal transduction histidine kinase
LNICHRIMQAHGGSIEVESEPGRFCEFALELPAGEPAAHQERMTA